MSRLKQLASDLGAQEAALAASYRELEQAADSEIGRRLAVQAARYQAFQLRCLDLLSGELPERFAGFGSITQSSVNLRSGPGGQYELTAVLEKGEQVILQDSRGFWVEVQVVGGAHGWVFRDYVRADDPGSLSEGSVPGAPVSGASG